MTPGVTAASDGIGKSRRQSERYHELHKGAPGCQWFLDLAHAMNLRVQGDINRSFYYFWWPGFTDVSIYEHPHDMTLAVRIKLRSEKTIVLYDPIEGFPSAKLINAINLLRD